MPAKRVVIIVIFGQQCDLNQVGRRDVAAIELTGFKLRLNYNPLALTVAIRVRPCRYAAAEKEGRGQPDNSLLHSAEIPDFWIVKCAKAASMMTGIFQPGRWLQTDYSGSAAMIAWYLG
jgi:hypothetical protein